MEDFVHLHVHTYYSILDGQASIPKLVDKAIADGMKGMAITDHGNMFGIKEFFDYCKNINKARKDEGLEPFKPIFGCEMYVARHNKEDKIKENGDLSGYHLIVLAKNENGYRNLIQLVSRAWVDGLYGRPRTDRKDLEQFHEDLIICSACLGGEVPRNLINNDIAAAREAIEWYHNIWGDDYYLELQRHEVTDPTVIANRDTYPLQQKVNKILIELAHEYGIKLVCTNDSHFVDKENAEAHDHLLCLSTGKDLNDPNRMRYSKQEWFKSKAEMNAIFSDVPESLSNTLEILDKVETYNIDSDPIMPFFPIPEDFGTEEEWRKKFTEEELYKEFTSDENGENQLSEEDGLKKIKHLGGYDKIYRIKFEADYLAKLAYDGAHRIYGDPLSQEVEERIKFELHIMKTMGFPGYFLIVSDFINAARNELGVWVGPGRGSAAGSVVAYCLGITKIDPLKYDLLFERFLNPDRVSLPDIDTDFDDDGRGRVLQWVMDKYGHENCAHIITYGTMATKNSIKDVARVEGLPLDRSNALCKAIPDRLPDGLKMNLPNVLKTVPAIQDAATSSNPLEANTIKYAKMLEGTVRSTGIHACGFIICRDPISQHVPVSTADDPDFPDIKTAVTQYDGHVIESTGLIKMDFLGLKTLSEMKECVRLIKLTTGEDVDLDNIPIDDPLTYKLYQEGRTIGTFQFESPGMQKYLRELHPTVFGDLIAMNALYRPGPMDNIPSFIRRKHGTEPITYQIPEMEKYLGDTYGICVYQEQVMLLSRLLAGFTRGQSDSLRKAMGKKKLKDMEKLEKLFYEGGVARGHDQKVLADIWEEWKKFASYAFNKSHAACYSWVAFQTAYLKSHYPAQFMAALMTRRKDDIKEITKLMDECKSMNMPVLGPDINESIDNFTVNVKGEIRFGLAGIKGVSGNSVASIIEERTKNGAYKDIYDLVERVNLTSCNRKNFECLAWAGAFDTFGMPRETYFTIGQNGEQYLDTLLRYGNRYQADKQEAMTGLFGATEIAVVHPDTPRNVELLPDLDRLNRERDLIGIYLSAHPLDEYSIILENMCNTRLEELADINGISGRSELTFGGIVTAIKTGSTKNGQPYGIVSLEDFNGKADLRLFSREWMQNQNSFCEGVSVYVRATLVPFRWDATRMDLHINSVDLLPNIKDTLIQRVVLEMPLESINNERIEDLKDIANENPGNAELYFRIVNGDKNVELKASKCKISVGKDLAYYVNINSDTIKMEVS